MSEKERIKPDKKNTLLFYSVTTLIILISFFLFVPKISSSLFPFKRHMLWDTFLTQVQKDRKIDPQKYWEFREFYSPGYFTDNKTASTDEITNALKKYGIKGDRTFTTLLVFHAKNAESIDTLTTMTKFDAIIAPLPHNNILFKNNDSLIYKPDETHVVITFLKPLSEMEKANGFFDYREKDKELVKGKMWFNITKLTLP